MWIPYTDTVVVVTNDPLVLGAPVPEAPDVSDMQANKPFFDLAKEETSMTGNGGWLCGNVCVGGGWSCGGGWLCGYVGGVGVGAGGECWQGALL